MKDGERLSLEQIRAFLAGSEEVGFKAANQRQLYEWIARTLCAQQYPTLGRSGKGLVRQYLAKVTGLSRAQVTRLIGKYAESGTVQVRRSPGRRFTSQYNPADIGLLALGGCGARHIERSGHTKDSVPGIFRIRRRPLRATGEHFGGTYL